MKPNQPSRIDGVRRSRRLSLGFLMFLILTIGVGLGLADYRCRVRVIFANDSDRTVRAVTITNDGRQVIIGPVAPHTSDHYRVRSNGTGSIRVAFDVAGCDGEPDRHVEAPRITANGYGSTVQVGYR